MINNPKNLSSQASISLGAWLISQKLVTASQLELAKRESLRLGTSLAEIIQRLGLVTGGELSAYRSFRGATLTAQEFISAQAEEKGRISLRRLSLTESLKRRLPVDLCNRTQSIAIAEKDGKLWVACANPFDLPTISALETHAQIPVEVLPAAANEIQLAITRNFRADEELHEAVDTILRMDENEMASQQSEDSSMIRLAEQILVNAAVREASDIHLHPEERFLRIRLRIDGVLEEGLLLPSAIRRALTARFKILASLDIAEDRLPQDGRIHFEIGKEEIDIRVSSLPCSDGESLVMRILDQSNLSLDLRTLGFTPNHRSILNRTIDHPHGVFLITGPTGSGKTTTLYTLLGMIDAEQRSVFTLEDPIEYRLPLIRQTQVRDEIGLSFSMGLRTLLRQDPDVILVGETRDEETARLMIRASLTGHLVFSTLHTNDALSAIPRLIDLTIPPHMLAESLIGLSAQRLARRLCPVCRESYQADPGAFNRLVPTAAVTLTPKELPNEIYRASESGCQACGGKGYAGRLSIAEIIEIDGELREFIERNQTTQTMRDSLRKTGTSFMLEDACAKVIEGLTSLEEVSRLVQNLEL